VEVKETIDWLLLFVLLFSHNSIRDINIKRNSLEHRKARIERRAFKRSFYYEMSAKPSDVRHKWTYRDKTWFHRGLMSRGVITLRTRWPKRFKRKISSKKFWHRALPVIVVLVISVFYQEAIFGLVGVAYTSSQTGDFDNVATWGGGGFPQTGDTATIQGTHIVSVKGTEACNTCLINATGTLRFDGQAVTSPVVAQLTGALTNNGTIDQLNTDATGYARIISPTTNFSGTQPAWSNGHWRVEHKQMPITTGGNGCTIESANSASVIVNSGDTFGFINATIMNGALTIDDGATITGGTNAIALYVDCTWTDNRITKTKVCSITLFEAYSVDLTLASDFIFHNISISSSCTMNFVSYTVNVEGDFFVGTVGAQLLIAGTSTIIMSGTAAQSIDANYNDGHFYNLTISNSSAKVTCTDDIWVDGTLSILAGSDFDLSDEPFYTSGDINISNTATVSGTGRTTQYWVIKDSGTYTDNNGTAVDIGNFYVDTGATLTLASDITVQNFGGIGVFDAGGAYTIKTDGDVDTSSLTFTCQNSVLQFAKNGSQIWTVADGQSFYDILVDATADVTLGSKVSVGGSTTGAFTFDQTGTGKTIAMNDVTITGILRAEGQASYSSMSHKVLEIIGGI